MLLAHVLVILVQAGGGGLDTFTIYRVELHIYKPIGQ